MFPAKRIALAILASAGLLCASLITTDLSTLLDSNTYWAKIELLQNFPALFSKHWISGIGAGSLALEYHQTIQPNFEAISLFSTQYIVTHFENLTLQTFLDHGLFKGLIIAGLALWALAKVLKNSRPLAVILLFVWLADASDFSFESGAMLFLCSLTLALVPNQSSWQFNVARLSKQWALVCILGLAFCPTWLLAGPNYLNPRHSYAQAILAYRNGDWDKIEPWIQYTLHRRPVHYNSHLTLARAYRDITGYQLAIASNPGAFKTLLEESKNPKIIPIETKAALEILIKWHIKHKEPSMALSALIKLLNGRSPKGKEAIWLAEIRTFQQGIKKTLIESNDWHLELQDPCPFVRWRMHHLRYSLGAKEALSELEQTRDCLLNPELLRADLLIGMGEYARAMQIIRGIWRANPSDASIRSRYLSLEKALTPK
ncbi:MAG: hypothetical protein JKY15_03465 [Deltaproteobacteria bacterium]|nr:hypothetical protein [Deltaproteobacteria bacterium]